MKVVDIMPVALEICWRTLKDESLPLWFQYPLIVLFFRSSKRRPLRERFTLSLEEGRQLTPMEVTAEVSVSGLPMFWIEVAELALSLELKEYEPLIWAVSVGLSGVVADPLAVIEPLMEKPLKGENPVEKEALHEGNVFFVS